MHIRLDRPDEKTLRLVSPYHPDVPPQAKSLGGKYLGGDIWQFDARDEERVRALVLEIFGTDGSPTTTVTMRCTADSRLWGGAWRTKQIFLAGRSVARCFGRDSGAKLGEGVVVVAGEGFGSGGSRSNPTVTVETGTVFEIRDVPEGIAERVAAQYPELIELVRDAPPAQAGPAPSEHSQRNEAAPLQVAASRAAQALAYALSGTQDTPPRDFCSKRAIEEMTQALDALRDAGVSPG